MVALLLAVMMIGSLLLGSISVSPNFDKYRKEELFNLRFQLALSGIGFAIPG